TRAAETHTQVENRLSWLRSDEFLSALAVVFAVLAALLTARSKEGKGVSHEALTGWVFLASSSLSILIVSYSPHGLEEIHRLLFSSIIGATATDVWIFAVLLVITAITFAVCLRRILLAALDPETATAVGVRTRLWALGFALWLGLTVGLAI